MVRTGDGERRLLSLLRGHRMKALLKRMLDPAEFLSDYGSGRCRTITWSIQHFLGQRTPLTVDYEPAESRSRLFGGQLELARPVWFQ